MADNSNRLSDDELWAKCQQGGSAAAGALSMAFGCTLMAPHGGIFVFPVVGNAIMYLVALVAGTVISAVLLGVLKKKII